MSPKFADSWYEATARRDAPLPSLEGDLEADVCVVGAGLSGCSTALHLAQRGYKVVVLEAERIGYGASGRSGGQIIPGWAGGMDKIAGQLGKGDARRVWDFSSKNSFWAGTTSPFTPPRFSNRRAAGFRRFIAT